MVTVAKLSADLTANTSKFEAGLARASGALGNARKKWDNDSKAMAGGFNGLSRAAGLLSAAIGGISISAFGRMAIAVADKMQNLKERTGATASFFSALESNVENAGGSVDGLGKSFTIMQTNISAALRGTQSAIEKFKQLGINVEDLRNLTPEEQFYRISDALSTLGTQYERTEAARAIFGKGAVALNPILAQGGTALRELVAQQEALGNALTDSQVARIDDFGDSINTVAKNIRNNLVGAFADLLTKIDELFSQAERAQRMAGARSGGTTGNVPNGGYAGLGAAYGEAAMAENARKAREAEAAYLAKAQAGGFATSIGNSGINVDLKSEFEKKYGAMKSSTSLTSKNDAAEKQLKLADNIANALKKENDNLSVQVGLYGQKQSVIDRAQKMAAIENEIAAAGISLTAQQKKDIEELLDKNEQLNESNNELLEQTKKIEEAERERQQGLQQFVYSLDSAFEEAIIGGKKLSEVLSSLAQDIAKIALRTSVTAPLGKFLGAGLGDFFGGFFANGGNPPVGKYSVVGENGPELIKPASATTVVPNHALGGGGNNFEANITVNMSGGGQDQGQQVATMVRRELDTWWSTKTADSLRPGNQLNPLF